MKHEHCSQCNDFCAITDQYRSAKIHKNNVKYVLKYHNNAKYSKYHKVHITIA